MAPSRIVVPSDVSLAEHKYSEAPRKLTLTDRIGLLTVFPLYRRNYVKLSRGEMRAVLTKNYGSNTPADIKEALETRRAHIHRKMMGRSFGLLGTVVGAGLTGYSMRHYDIKGRFMPIPFAAYLGNAVGRGLGGLVSGSWAAGLRARYLDANDLKNQLHYMEQELMASKVMPVKRMSRGDHSKVTKDSFLKAQSQETTGSSDFVYDLISKPSRSLSRPPSRPTSRPPSRQISRPVSRTGSPKQSRESFSRADPSHHSTRPVDPQAAGSRGGHKFATLDSGDGTSESSDPIPTRSHQKSLDHAIQLRLYDERRRMESEYKRIVDTLKRDMEELRHKRVCDKETFKEELEKYERDMVELRGLNKALEDANMRALHDVETLQNHNRDLRSEVEKLNRDMDRQEQRQHKAQQNIIELEGKLRGEQQAFEQKSFQQDKIGEDLKENIRKLKCRDEQNLNRINGLNEELAGLQQELATSKALVAKLTDDAERLSKKHESEIDDYEKLRSSYALRHHEVDTELQCERERLVVAQDEIRRLTQENSDMRATILTKDKDTRDLVNLKELHQTVSSERLVLQTQYRALSDECERVRNELHAVAQSHRAALNRADAAERESHQLKKKIEALQVNFSRNIVSHASSRGDVIEGLTDTDGAPLCRLRSTCTAPGKPTTVARPVWWFEQDDNQMANNACDVVRRKPPLVPVGRPLPETSAPLRQPTSGMTVLKAEQRRIRRELAKMPPNPAYRTTVENELHDDLRRELNDVEEQIRLLDHVDR